MDSQKREVILLRVRNLLADRDIIKAVADRQTHTQDGWLLDHASESWKISCQIEALLQTLEVSQ